MTAEAPTLDPIYMAACQFGMRGLRLLPVEHHSRSAILPEWPRNATNDVELIDRWFEGGNNNLGLCCGPQPAGWNLLCVDVDNRETWQALEAQHGKLDAATTCFHRTPSGGLHLFFDVPEGYAVTGTDVFGPGIDARGGREGAVGCGYVLLPPSVAPSKATGELLSYGAGPGRGLLDREPGPAPAWILALIEAHLNPPVRQPTPAGTATHQSQNGDDPWSWVRDNLRWDDYLGKHGWQPSGGQYWTRPGKSVRDGHSAQLHDDGRLAIWTGEIPNEIRDLGSRQSDGGISISLADFITAYEFGGDRQAFGRRVRLELMPSPSASGRVGTGDEGEPEASADALEDWSWSTPVDMQAILDGTLVQPTPTVMERADGVALFYPGAINGIHGESGLGKGWVALTAAAEQIRLGNTVLYLDMEDTMISIVSRLKILGLAIEDIVARLVYVRPDEPTSAAQIAGLVALVKRTNPSLVIIDSLGEAFGLDGINENNDNEVAPWLRHVPRAVADLGPCVIIVDHVTKAMDNPLYPKGSGRKRGAIGGAQYLVEAIKPLVKGGGGRLRLTTAKDRNGTHARGAVAAEVVFTASGIGGEDMRTTVSPGLGANDRPTEQQKLEAKAADKAVEMAQQIRATPSEFGRTEFLLRFAGNTQVKHLAFKMCLDNGTAVEVPGKAGRFKRGPG